MSYQVAEKRIQECLELGSTRLNLSNLGLTEVPDSISQLTNLKWLYLSNNQISVIPDSIANLTSLKRLHLSNNQISVIPDSIHCQVYI